MKKLLFALSMLGVLALCACNVCKVGDCTCIMWTFENRTNETVFISDLKDGIPSDFTIPPYASVDVYVESAAESLSFNHKPSFVRPSRVKGDYTYKFVK
ncbi:MAG: hypothetical protein UHW86_04220 [Spirochaetota bacterium]|nr:hypothetical protein [Spirochaetota bacterium]